MKTVSFVIPVRPGNFPRKAVEHIRALNYPPELMEVLIAEGRQPSLQRNQAVQQANGDCIYFLDDDSYISKNCVTAGLSYLDGKQIAAVGGPALSEAGATFLQELFGEIAGSIFGTLHTRTRNRPVGKARIVSGEELILCNLLISRHAFLEISGLDVRLYPNEENELFKRLQKAGYNFYYLPQMLVKNGKRKSIGAFLKQMYSYGAGRGNHILRGFRLADLVFFAPSTLVIYLAVLQLFPRLWPLLFVYLCFIGIGAIFIGIRRKSARFAFAVASFPLFFLMHLSYGIGLLGGLLPQKRTAEMPESSVSITRIEFGALRMPFDASGG